MEYNLKAIHNISRPGETPREGDTIEVETANGFLPEVDPVTRKAKDTRKQFTITSTGDSVTFKP